MDGFGRSNFFIIFLMGILLSGCWYEKTYSKEDLYKIGKKKDSQLNFTKRDDIVESILSCHSYGRYCQSVFSLSYRGVSFICVEYGDAQRALEVAEIINAYVVRNWLLDHVTGEPILERFVQGAWGAKKVKSL